MRKISNSGSSFISLRSHDTTDEEGLFIQVSQSARGTENDALISDAILLKDTLLSDLHHELLALERICIDPSAYPERYVSNRPVRTIYQEVARCRWIAGQPSIKKLALTWEDVRGYLNEATVILHAKDRKV